MVTPHGPVRCRISIWDRVGNREVFEIHLGEKSMDAGPAISEPQELLLLSPVGYFLLDISRGLCVKGLILTPL